MCREGRRLFPVIAFYAGLSLLGGQQEPRFSAAVQVVNVLATVRDEQGGIVRDLTRNDFILEEEGRPQIIRYFTQQTDLPLTIGLLVDTSVSQWRVLPQERSASRRFLQQVLRGTNDSAFVIRFDRDVELLEDATSSRKALEAGLAQLERGRPRSSPRTWPSGTLLCDALVFASQERMRKHSGRKALIVLTDGVDVGSKASLAQAIEAAQRADTLVYSIRFYDDVGVGVPGSPYSRNRDFRVTLPERYLAEGKDAVQQISGRTGGGYFEASSKLPLEDVFARIEEEIRSQYNLGYTSDRPQGVGEFRKLRLVTRRMGLVVQARDGYYAVSRPGDWPVP